MSKHKQTNNNRNICSCNNTNNNNNCNEVNDHYLLIRITSIVATNNDDLNEEVNFNLRMRSQLEK